MTALTDEEKALRKQYAFAPLVNGEGFGVTAKEEKAYAQALGFARDNPGASDYEIANYLAEAAPYIVGLEECESMDPDTLRRRVSRWRGQDHWKAHITK